MISRNSTNPKLTALLLGITVFAASTLTYSKAFAETRTFQAIAVEISGTKFWLPSTMIVKKGDTVKIHAVSKIPGKNNIHGFQINDFKINALADDQGLLDDKGKHSENDIEFVASKAGIFTIRCQLHPAHIGGQLVVLD